MNEFERSIKVLDLKGEVSKDTVKKLADKEIKLVVYSSFSSSVDYMNVDSVSTYDFGKVSESIFRQKEKRNTLRIPLLIYYTRSVGELNPSCKIDSLEYFPIY